MNWHSASYHMQTVALWAIVIVLALFVAASSKRTTSGGPGESAEQVLKRRYAAGEIDRDTYQRMLADLQHGAADRDKAA